MPCFLPDVNNDLLETNNMFAIYGNAFNADILIIPLSLCFTESFSFVVFFLFGPCHSETTAGGNKTACNESATIMLSVIRNTFDSVFTVILRMVSYIHSSFVQNPPVEVLTYITYLVPKSLQNGAMFGKWGCLSVKTWLEIDVGFRLGIGE